MGCLHVAARWDVVVTEPIVLAHRLAAAGHRSASTLDRTADASDDPILARLALWLADVAAEATRDGHQVARATEPPERKARE